MMRNSIRSLTVLTLLLAASVLPACSGAPTLTTPVSVPTVPAAASPTAAPTVVPDVVLTGKEGTTPVAMKVGQVLSVQLSNRKWSQPAVDTSVLQLLPGGAVNVEGNYRWDYKAIAPGTTTLTSDGACLPNPNGPACMSIIVYKVTITVTQ